MCTRSRTAAGRRPHCPALRTVAGDDQVKIRRRSAQLRERRDRRRESLALVEPPDEQQLHPRAEVGRLGVFEPSDIRAVRHDLERPAEA